MIEPKKCWIEVDVKDELPPEQTECYFTMLKVQDEPIIMGSHLWNFNDKQGWDEEEDYTPPNIWLKEQSVYIFSKEELAALLKDAFCSGSVYEYEKHFGAVPPLSENEEQYINSKLNPQQ